MGIDAGIYSNIQSPANNSAPYSPTNSVENAYKLSNLGMQHAQMQLQMQRQQSIRQAAAQNTDSKTGELNHTGFLSTLGQLDPMARMDQEERIHQMEKQAAETKASQYDAAQKAVGVVWPGLKYVDEATDKPQAYAAMLKNLKDQNVDTTHFAPEYEPSNFNTMFKMAEKSKPVLENFLTQASVGEKQAQTAKTYADIGKIPLEKQNLQFGARSANSELTGQYDKQADTVRKSQLAMKQMLDNYNNVSPQGDASLVLNAFKIKFPTAPDVNSLDELSHAEGTTPQMKNWVSQRLSGLKDPGVRDDLMRDGISTYRANVESLRGIQKRTQTRQKFQGVNDPTMTYEPAIEDTYSQSMRLQKQIGPYIPPTERGGVTGAIGKIASKIMGIGGDQNSNASTQQTKLRPTGEKVTGSELSQYATKHNMKLDEAEKFLRSHGYAVNR